MNFTFAGSTDRQHIHTFRQRRLDAIVRNSPSYDGDQIKRLFTELNDTSKAIGPKLSSINCGRRLDHRHWNGTNY